MPRKTRKRPTSKKAKTKAKTTAKIYKNKNVSQKVFKQIYKKSKALENCKAKHCNKLMQKREQYQKKIYEAVGWNKQMTKRDPSKRNPKLLRKYERLQRQNDKDLEECVKQFCNAEDKALKQIYNNSVANLK